jgi:hypothetical protein
MKLIPAALPKQSAQGLLKTSNSQSSLLAFRRCIAFTGTFDNSGFTIRNHHNRRRRRHYHHHHHHHHHHHVLHVTYVISKPYMVRAGTNIIYLIFII